MMMPAWLLQEPPAQATQDDSSFSIKVNVDLVVLNATVVDREGKNVTRLKREDFSIHEDKVPQEVSEFLPVEAPFNLALVLDTSSSVRTSLTLIKKAANEFAHQLRSTDRIGIAEFNASVRQVLNFTSDRGVVKRAINNLAVSRYGGSKVYDGIAQAVYRLRESSSGRNAIVILSDGLENSSRFKFDGLRILLAQSDAVLFPVTMLNKERQQNQLEAYINSRPESDPYVANARASLAFLTEMYQMQTERLLTLAHDSGGRVFVVSDLTELAGEYSKIAQELRTTYSLAYYSTNPQRDGTFRELRVAVRDPGFKVLTRSRYFVPREE
jgi:Ca-activated chloride channel family protein